MLTSLKITNEGWEQVCEQVCSQLWAQSSAQISDSTWGKAWGGIESARAAGPGPLMWTLKAILREIL